MGNVCSHSCRLWCLWWCLILSSPFFPRDVLNDICDWIESIPETFFYLLLCHPVNKNICVKVFWARGYKPFFMLNSSEHEMFHADKCWNANINLCEQENSILCLLEPEKCFISWYFKTHLKCHPQLSSAWQKFYNLDPWCSTILYAHSKSDIAELLPMKIYPFILLINSHLYT